MSELKLTECRHYPVEIACYQIEIVVPQGTHSYMYSSKIPSNDELKEKYGLFARIGNVSTLMHVVQHTQILEAIHERSNFY